MFVYRLAVAAMVMTGAVVSLDFAWSFAGFIIYIFLLTHNNIKHHHQHETYGEANGAEIAVLAALLRLARAKVPRFRVRDRVLASSGRWFY